MYSYVYVCRRHVLYICTLSCGWSHFHVRVRSRLCDDHFSSIVVLHLHMLHLAIAKLARSATHNSYLLILAFCKQFVACSTMHMLSMQWDVANCCMYGCMYVLLGRHNLGIKIYVKEIWASELWRMHTIIIMST